MTAEIYKDFEIQAAHFLPKMPDGHPCRYVHGHSYRVRVICRGPVNPDNGIVVEYDEIKRAFAPLHDLIDHRTLNNIDGLENPTCENLAAWLWERLEAVLPTLYRIEIGETGTAGVSITRQHMTGVRPGEDPTDRYYRKRLEAANEE